MMAAEVGPLIPAAPVIHLQLVLPQCDLRLPALVEDCDGLWDRVNRICDQYMPELLELGSAVLKSVSCTVLG